MKDTNGVLETSLLKLDISKNSAGQTTKEATPQDGWRMFKEGAWSEAAKSFGITESALLWSSFFIGIFIGVSLYSWSNRHKGNQISFSGHTYRLIALAQNVQNGKSIYFPVYEEAH